MIVEGRGLRGERGVDASSPGDEDADDEAERENGSDPAGTVPGLAIDLRMTVNEKAIAHGSLSGGGRRNVRAAPESKSYASATGP